MGRGWYAVRVGWLGLGLAALPACGASSSMGAPDAPSYDDHDLVGGEADLVVDRSIEDTSLGSSETGAELASALPEASGFEAGPPCSLAYAGCDTFTDRTAADADRTVHFQNYSYDPQCLMIRSGQTVTFRGDFIVHPLTPACGPELVLYDRDTSTTAAFTLTITGIYGYYCLDHGNPAGAAMSGAIAVVP
jgi:plastocyanin